MSSSLLLKLAIAILTGTWASLWGVPDVTPRGMTPRTWRDAAGKPIKVLDEEGRLCLITRDGEGKIIQIVAMKGRFTHRTAENLTRVTVAWSHRFTYKEDGGLIGEVDCRGTIALYTDDQARTVDEFAGTARPGHRHEVEFELENKKVHYDEQGRIIRD